MFFSDTIKIRGLVPAPFALVGPRPAPGFARFAEVDTLPPELFSKDRSHFLQAVVDRADAMWPCPFIFIVGKTQAVVILDTLPRAFRGIIRVGIIVAETDRP